MKYTIFFCLLNLFPDKKPVYMFILENGQKKNILRFQFIFIFYTFRDFITLQLQSIYLIYSIFYF